MRVTRSSTRAKANDPILAKPKYDDSDSVFGCASDEDDMPSRKRRKRNPTKNKGKGGAGRPAKTTGLGRRKAGKLSLLMKVPVDVFYEIACYLKPVDLLNLSRSSRALRDLLMTNKSSYVWRAARESLDLPSVPSQLSEPQYANLMFGVGCQLCDNGRARKTYYAFFTRLCKNCSEANISDGCFLLHQILEEANAERKEEETKLFLTLAPSQEDPQDPYASKPFKLYFKPQLASAIQGYLALKKSGQATDSFVEERLSLTEEALEKSALMEKWKDRQRFSRQEELAGLTISRRSKILARLRDLGYQDKDFSSYDDLPGWRWKQLVNQPRDLTERMWINMKPELEDIIRLRRARRIELQKERNRLSRCMEIQSFYNCCRTRQEARDDEDYEARSLRVEDLLTKPVVKRLTENGDSSQPIMLNQWTEIEKMLPELIQDHVLLIHRNCYNSLSGAHRSLNKNVDLNDNILTVFDGDYKMDDKLLKSATSFFTTKYYSPSVQSFADILRMRLTTQNPFTSYNSATAAGCPWEDLGVRANLSAVQASIFLLKEAGFAQWASMQHLRSKGCSFKCKRCPKDSRYFMTWSHLVTHFVEKNKSELPGEASHELLHRKKKSVVLLKGEVVDEEEPKDTSKSSFNGVLEGIDLPPDPQTIVYDSEGSDSEDYYSDDYPDYDMDLDFDMDDWGYFSGDEYPDSEDGGCIIS